MIKVLALIGLLIINGCGRAALPLPPESLAPISVQNLVVSAQDHSLTFSWNSPEKDLRGKELKSIDGYKIYRRANSETEDLLIASIKDTHVEVRDRLRAEAKKNSKPIRKIKLDPNLKSFTYIDSDVKSGNEYFYKIIPFNQTDVDGQILEQIKVFFSGSGSLISMIPITQVSDL